ncbi:hypothetical protein SPRG_17308 [Saprolegnia parasitica CBS 223.65]|uniref:Uncharacterized protein n=1 Tax=Saprolegnia parasitica (strain CBS 223.65) TaxID=695850 RepID=A0A067BF02_SAPPC|nr:hypothetical protein SPRG_17308 [Saprolegnia parasitica CBS 223.65]KDO16969.1 hypothetical protein SPRG_17308 [Saprolegnia parasitica CBS 223.65]|eukprot:XP_012212323.1 hypothetical protein SPRG_17308 [Saprolegnia parasitica CBS 223.65]
MLAYDFQTSDASATLIALGAALVSALGGVWFCLRTSLVHGLFLHGLGLCGLSLTSLYVAVVPEMAVRWSMAPLAVSSELLEYKLAIVSGIACVALLILHALLVLLVRP